MRVRRLEGSAFVAVGGTPSVSSGEGSRAAVITAIGGVPYVAWGEQVGGVGSRARQAI